MFLPVGRRGPLASRGPYASILPVYQQRDWGPGMVKCVGTTRCLMRPWERGVGGNDDGRIEEKEGTRRE